MLKETWDRGNILIQKVLWIKKSLMYLLYCCGDWHVAHKRAIQNDIPAIIGFTVCVLNVRLYDVRKMICVVCCLSFGAALLNQFTSRILRLLNGAHIGMQERTTMIGMVQD
jgi:hypothetical protein